MERLWEKMKGLKKDQWIVLFLVGILIMTVAIPVKEEKAPEEEQAANVQGITAGAGAGSGSEGTAQDTIQDMERRLENVLSSLDGAGKVQVMITWKTSGEKIVEKDIPVSSQDSREEGESGEVRSSTQQERNEATVYARDADGSELPYVVRETAPEIGGVLVLAQGGNHPEVAADITEAVMALFGIEAHKIKVMKMN